MRSSYQTPHLISSNPQGFSLHTARKPPAPPLFLYTQKGPRRRWLPLQIVAQSVKIRYTDADT